MSDAIVAPETRELEVVSKGLTAWFGQRLPQAQAIEVANLDYPRGAGQNHETILFDLAWTEAGMREELGCVLRIKPRSFQIYPDNLFDEQVQAMEAVHATGLVRVARPLWFESDAALFGAPFLIMEKKHGRVPVSIPPYGETGWVFDATPAQRRHMWEAGVAQLAAIQTVPLENLAFLAGRDGLSGFEQEWGKFSRFVDWVVADVPSPALQAGLARLESRFPDNRTEGMVWGDARLGNMMFDDNFDVVAVMDWEQPSLGGALHDLAWFNVISERMHGEGPEGVALEGMGSRLETIALWEDLSGKSAADIEWYEEFTHLKMTCLALRMGFLCGQHVMTEAAIATAFGLDTESADPIDALNLNLG